MIDLILWLLFIYVIVQLVRGLVRNAVHRGIRDYERQKEAHEKKEKEVKIDRSKIEDAKFKDLK